MKTYTETRFNYGNSSGDYLDQGASNADNWQAPNKPSLRYPGFSSAACASARIYGDVHRYAGIIQDTLVPYGGQESNVVQYYFDAGNGFSGVVSLEEGAGKVGTIDSYVPHVVGGLKYKGDWGAVTGVVAYDSNYEEVAGKVRLDVNVSKELTLFIMGGYGTYDNLNDNAGNAIDASGRGFYKQWGGNWAVWGGGTYKFNAKTSFNAQVSYDDWKNLGVAANVAYTVVPGFTVTAEVDASMLESSATPTATGPRPTRRAASAAFSASSARSNGSTDLTSPQHRCGRFCACSGAGLSVPKTHTLISPSNR